MLDLIKQQSDDVLALVSKKEQVVFLLEKLPKRRRTEMEASYYPQFQEIETLCDRLVIEALSSGKIIDAVKENVYDNISTFQDVSSSKLPLSSQPSSSSAIVSFSIFFSC